MYIYNIYKLYNTIIYIYRIYENGHFHGVNASNIMQLLTTSPYRSDAPVISGVHLSGHPSSPRSSGAASARFRPQRGSDLPRIHRSADAMTPTQKRETGGFTDPAAVSVTFLSPPPTSTTRLWIDRRVNRDPHILHLDPGERPKQASRLGPEPRNPMTRTSIHGWHLDHLGAPLFPPPGPPDGYSSAKVSPSNTSSVSRTSPPAPEGTHACAWYSPSAT